MAGRRKDRLSGPFAQDLDASDLRRQRQKARELRQSQWWKRKRDRGVCHWCGRSVPPAELTMDHIVPLARGGRSVKGNVVAACKKCNTRKKQMLPMEWELFRKSLKRGDAEK